MDGFFKHSRSFLQQTARDKRLTVADRRILDVAMLYTRNPGESVGLGIDFLVQETGLYRSTVICSRRRLAELGYLVPSQSGLHGLSCFVIATGRVETTPDDDDRGRVETTGSGRVETTPDDDDRGRVETTGSGRVETTPFTLHETRDLETVQHDEKSPSPEPPPSPLAKPPKPPKKPKAEIKPHPVFLEWNEERIAAGLPASKIGPQNNTFAAKLGELVSDPAIRRKVLQAFFARKNDNWLTDEGFVFYQLVNHRLDQCVAAANKREVQMKKRPGGLEQMRAARLEAERLMYGHELKDA